MSTSAIVVICFISIGIIIGENNADRYNGIINNLLRVNDANNNGGDNGSAAVDAATVGEMILRISREAVGVDTPPG